MSDPTKAEELFLQLHVRLNALEGFVTQVVGSGIAASSDPKKTAADLFERARTWSLKLVDAAAHSGSPGKLALAEVEVKALLGLLDRTTDNAREAFEALRDEVLAKARAPSEAKN